MLLYLIFGFYSWGLYMLSLWISPWKQCFRWVTVSLDQCSPRSLPPVVLQSVLKKVTKKRKLNNKHCETTKEKTIRMKKFYLSYNSEKKKSSRYRQDLKQQEEDDRISELLWFDFFSTMHNKKTMIMIMMKLHLHRIILWTMKMNSRYCHVL